MSKSKAGTPLSEYQLLYDAVEAFVESHVNFENNETIEEVLDELKKTTDYRSMFKIPLAHKLFSMQSAMEWLIFIQLATKQDTQGGNTNKFSSLTNFSADDATNIILNVYTQSIEQNYLEFFAADSEDEDDDEDEDD